MLQYENARNTGVPIRVTFDVLRESTLNSMKLCNSEHLCRFKEARQNIKSSPRPKHMTAMEADKLPCSKYICSTILW